MQRQFIIVRPTGEVNLRFAAADDFATISGIGDALAEKIIEKRVELGGFTKPEDLLEVDGIGPALFNRIKDKVFLD